MSLKQKRGNDHMLLCYGEGSRGLPLAYTMLTLVTLGMGLPMASVVNVN